MGSSFSQYLAGLIAKAVVNSACEAIKNVTEASKAAKDEESLFEHIGPKRVRQAGRSDAKANHQNHKSDDSLIDAKEYVEKNSGYIWPKAADAKGGSRSSGQKIIRRIIDKAEVGSRNSQKVLQRIIDKIDEFRNDKDESKKKKAVSRTLHPTDEGLYVKDMTVIGIVPGRKSVIVHSDYREADDNAFFQDIDLECIRFTGIVDRVGSKACIGLENLKTVIFEQSVHEIAHEAFSWCISLEHVEFRGEVGIIGKACFNHCPSLKTVIFAQNVDEIGQDAFASCCSLERLEFQGRVGVIGKGCFQNCDGLRECIFQKSIKYIDQEAFKSCTALKKAEFHGDLDALGVASFFGCEELAEIVIPDSCSKIGAFCFGICLHLKYVHLPRELNTISEGLFYGCQGLQRIDWPESRIIDNISLPIVREKAFSLVLDYHLWERFELEDGCMIRRQANAAAEDPEHDFIIEPGGGLNGVQCMPRYILNSFLNQIWEITLSDKKSYHCLITILKVALRLACITARELCFDVRPFMLSVLAYRFAMLYDSSAIDDKIFDALLLYAIGFALYCSGGNGTKMEVFDTRILSLYYFFQGQEFEMRNFDADEKGGDRRYDMLILNAIECFADPDEAESFSVAHYRDVTKAILQEFSIGPDVLYRYDLLTFHFVIPMRIGDDNKYEHMNEYSGKDAVGDYYSFSHAIRSLVKFHYGIDVQNFQDLSNEAPEVWLKVWAKEIREELPELSLVHISLKKGGERLEDRAGFEKEFLDYIDCYEIIINTDYAMLCTQAQIDDMSKLFKKYELEKIMTVYNNELHLL